MDLVEQKIIELRGEVIKLREDLEKLKAKVTSLVVGQNQPLIPPPINHQAPQREISSVNMALSQFQGLSLDNKKVKENRANISSLKDAQKVVQSRFPTSWGHVVTLSVNNHREGLGFSPASAKADGSNVAIKTIKETFHSAGFIYPSSSKGKTPFSGAS
ncbi:hypothetical protein QL285_072918 [Trifolium repens]|nr:hypothetical protein QL285_072918 [Trifolium repens]